MLKGSQKHRLDHVRTLKREIKEGEQRRVDLEDEVEYLTESVEEHRDKARQAADALARAQRAAGRTAAQGMEEGSELYNAHTAHRLAANLLRMKVDRLTQTKKELLLTKQGVRSCRSTLPMRVHTTCRAVELTHPTPCVRRSKPTNDAWRLQSSSTFVVTPATTHCVGRWPTMSIDPHRSC